MSFQEKSLLLVFVSLIAVFGFYFAAVLPDHPRQVLPNQVGLFAFVIVVLVVLQIVGHVIIALTDRRTQTDERDRLIELRGTRNGAYVLATGVFCSLCAALIYPGNFIFMHLLLAFWVLAQLVETGSQLFFYRREA